MNTSYEHPYSASELLALLDARCSFDREAWPAMLAKLGRTVNDFELIHKSRDLLRAAVNHDMPQDAAECPKCTGFGFGYVRTGPDDQWDSETCEWCFGTGYVPAPIADLLRDVRRIRAEYVDEEVDRRSDAAADRADTIVDRYDPDDRQPMGGDPYWAEEPTWD